MSRAAIYQPFRRIPDADDAAIDAAVDALADQVATKADLAELKSGQAVLQARLFMVLWALGLLGALNLAVLGALLAQAVL